MTPQEAINRLKRLDSERANWANYWQEIALFVLPRKAYITRTKTTGAQIDFTNIFDNTPIRALRTMSSGFHSWLTNPSSKWFQLAMQDSDLMNIRDVKIWLQKAEDEIFKVLNSSNFDQVAQEFYTDNGAFGTAVVIELEDLVDKVRFFSIPLSEVFLEEDATNRVIALYRKFQFTAQQAKDLWGDEAGEDVTKAVAKGDFLKKFTFAHTITKRDKFDPSKSDFLNMPWQSMWIEFDKSRLIKEGGFLEFPVMAGRWVKDVGETYGTSPAMDNFADIKMLNAMTKTVLRGAQKVVDPPLNAPSRGYVMPLNLNPGAINYRKQNLAADSLAPIITKGNIPIGIDMIRDLRSDVNKGFFVDLFKAFEQLTKQMTVPEVQQRIREGMTQLGPVIGRIQQEFLDPVIVRTFFILLRNGTIKPPPAQIQDEELVIQYISPMAKAQRESEITSINRTLATVSEMSSFVPTVLDKINADKAVDIVADIHGVNPEIIRDDEEVALIRLQRAQAQEQADKAIQMEQGAKTAKDVSQAEKNLAGKV